MSTQVFLRTSVAAVTFALTAPFMLSAEDAAVKEITVTAEPATADGMNAMMYYPQMEADLQQAIAERVPVSDAAKGYDVHVSLNRVALNGETMLPESQEFNSMQGTVTITSPQTTAAPRSYPVNLRASSAGPAPEGFVTIEPGPNEFYSAMIAAFADIVAQDLPEHMPTDYAR
ncbi:hypothetical protein [Pontibaca salina]|uniref:Uncharacterized protein n=1 Tax=Pontibaca salina TaxID=2795731 RepID=A0A934HRG6_9RHOB|nr:hypothetical protein [Pontibaca salina]MBI6630392.1 hypothetical protein [Pontibaca salina]